MKFIKAIKIVSNDKLMTMTVIKSGWSDPAVLYMVITEDGECTTVDTDMRSRQELIDLFGDQIIEFLEDQEPVFSLAEFRKYLETQDSRGDIHHYLTVDNIIKANS